MKHNLASPNSMHAADECEAREARDAQEPRKLAHLHVHYEYANTMLFVRSTWLNFALIIITFARLIGPLRVAQQWLSTHARTQTSEALHSVVCARSNDCCPPLERRGVVRPLTLRALPCRASRDRIAVIQTGPSRLSPVARQS